MFSAPSRSRAHAGAEHQRRLEQVVVSAVVQEPMKALSNASFSRGDLVRREGIARCERLGDERHQLGERSTVSSMSQATWSPGSNRG